MNLILFAFWFFLPAGIANMMPVFAMHLPIVKDWEYPLDFRKSYKGKRIFGDHKTIRGLVVGILSGIIISYIQFELYKNVSWVQSFVPFDYMKDNPFIFGFLVSFGALMGDAIKSFFKRRSNIPSGETWFPFDQIDYIIGGLLLSMLWVQFHWTIYLAIILLYFVLHLTTTTLGYFLHLKASAI